MQHVHVSMISFLVMAAQLVIFGFFWRYASVRLHETSLGKAMAFVY